jgi:hypothetical protein
MVMPIQEYLYNTIIYGKAASHLCQSDGIPTGYIKASSRPAVTAFVAAPSFEAAQPGIMPERI